MSDKSESRAKPAASATEQGSAKPSRARGKSDPVARALRVAYDDMLREDIPDDFMDLLGKLD